MTYNKAIATAATKATAYGRPYGVMKNAIDGYSVCALTSADLHSFKGETVLPGYPLTPEQKALAPTL